jgi:RNA polymerase sigma-32 factor
MAPEVEAHLICRWQDEGDARALEALVRACLPRVEYIARRYRHYPVDHEDLVGEGYVGLLTAIDRFDRSHGVRLMTYASFWIRAQMMRYITADWGHGKTGIGITRTKAFFRLRRERARCEMREMDEETMLRSLSRSFGLSETSTRRLLEALDVTEFSMDAGSPDSERNDGCLELAVDDLLPDVMLEGERRDALFSRLVGEALGVLDEREVFIIEERYAKDDPESLANLGRCLGISRERVRQIERGALRKMSQLIESTGFAGSELVAMVD